MGAVAGAYILAHGLTALVVTPMQARLLPDVTMFASLVYLPHGVRVLSAWLMLGGVAEWRHTHATGKVRQPSSED